MFSLDQVKQSTKIREKDWQNQFKLKEEKLQKKGKLAAPSFQKDNKMTFNVEIDVVNVHNPCCNFYGVSMENILDKRNICSKCGKQVQT